MLSPLFRLVTSEPHLLADHVEAYSELAVGELRIATTVWKRRLLLQMLGGASLLVFLVLAGVALMLWAALPGGTLNQPWLLVVVPLVPAAVAALSLLMASQSPDEEPFAMLRRQWAADAALLREAAAS